MNNYHYIKKHLKDKSLSSYLIKLYHFHQLMLEHNYQYKMNYFHYIYHILYH